MCALPKFGRQRPRPSGVPCRERDVVAGGVPEAPYRRADAARAQHRDLHSLLPSDVVTTSLPLARFSSMAVCASTIWSNRYTRALRLLAGRGYHGTGVSQLAASLGIRTPW